MAKDQFKDWDFRLDKNSIAAGIYVAWENELQSKLLEYFPDAEAEILIEYLQMAKLIEWIQHPEKKFGKNPSKKRDEYLLGTFESAVDGLQAKFGPDMNSWKYGQANYKHVQIKHPLGQVVNTELSAKFNTELRPRGGNQHTPGSTGSNNGQTSGATFRIIVDVNDWDNTVGSNPPGQSGNLESPFYKNLYDQWVNDAYFPVYFTKAKIDSVKSEKALLVPR